MMAARVSTGATKAIVPLACAVALMIPVFVWIISVGNPSAYFTTRVPPGQALYVLSKLCGLVAIGLFWFQCMTALARFSPVLAGFVHLSRRQHAALGVGTFIMILLHLLLFISASSVRTGHLAFSLLLPQLNKGYFAFYVSLGAVAFWVLVAVVIAGTLRLRGHVSWKWPHRLSIVTFILVFLHAVAIGSETRYGLMAYVYAFMALSLMTATASWIWMQFKRRSLARQVPKSSFGAVASDRVER